MIAGLYDCFKHWSAQGTVWVCSDTHFGNAEWMRPSDEEIVKAINSKVGRKDTLILLGDVGDISMAQRLKGYKVLIAGNHDVGLSAYKEVFNEVYGGPLLIADRLILSHEPIVEIPWAFNLHGHVHDLRAPINRSPMHKNCVVEALNYEPLNLNKFMRDGGLASVTSIHRATIDHATARKKKRNYENY